MTPRRGQEPHRWMRIFCPHGELVWVERWAGGGRHLGRLAGRSLSDEQLAAVLDEVQYDRKMADIRRGERPKGVHPNS